MKADGSVEVGDYIRLVNGRVYYVDAVTGSGAHLIELSGTPAIIRDKKKCEKGIVRHRRQHLVVTVKCGAELVDPNRLDGRLMHRRIEMARKNAEQVNENEQTTEQAAPTAQPKDRATQKYILTDKAPKEMKGQGKLVYDALKAAKEAGTPMNVAELTKAVAATGQLNTRQDAERVVGFYCSKFKRDGLVSVVKAETPAEEPAGAAV